MFPSQIEYNGSGVNNGMTRNQHINDDLSLTMFQYKVGESGELTDHSKNVNNIAANTVENEVNYAIFVVFHDFTKDEKLWNKSNTGMWWCGEGGFWLFQKMIVFP